MATGEPRVNKLFTKSNYPIAMTFDLILNDHPNLTLSNEIFHGDWR